MDKKIPLSEITSDLYEKLADKELRLGCKYQDEHDRKMGYENIIWECGIDSVGEFIRTDKHSDFRHGEAEFRKIFKVIGTEPTLNDVLLRLSEDVAKDFYLLRSEVPSHYIMISKESVVGEERAYLFKFDLTKSFDLQEESTLRSLHSLLITNG